MATLAVRSPMVIACPRCPKCGARMSLVCILADRTDCDQRLYECARCHYELTEVVNFRKAG